MEPFIIDAIREASKLITDPELQKEAKAWIGQESQHFMQHRRFNEVLIAKGYPQLREREKEIEHEYEELRKRSLKYQVAYTAGFETLALATAHTIIADRAHLFRGADPAVASMWLWHVVEEIEHKNLAFDVYQHVYGDYWYRVYGMFAALLISSRWCADRTWCSSKPMDCGASGRPIGRSRSLPFASLPRRCQGSYDTRCRGIILRMSPTRRGCGSG